MHKYDDQDQKIIDQLSDFPHVQSKLSKAAFYDEINSEMTPNHKKTMRKKKIFFPALLTAAVLAIVFVILKDQIFPPQMEQAMNDDVALETAENTRMTDDRSEEALEGVMLKDEIMTFNNPMYQTDDFSNVKGHHVIVPSDEAADLKQITVVAMDTSVMYPVPLTVIDQQGDSVNFYNEQLASFDFNQLGLTGETFDFGVFSQGDQSVTLTINSELVSIDSSAQATMFNQTLRYMFQDDYGRVFIEGANGEAIELGPFGTVDQFDLDRVQKLSYKYVRTSSGHKFMVPVETTLTGETFITIDEALVDMQEPVPDFNIEAAIPEGVTYTLDLSNEGEVKLTFDSHDGLGDNAETTDMFEAILMTAKSFDFNHVVISMEDIDINQVGPYLLDTALELPVAINPVTINQ
ncbi:hypothetical protein SAMN05421839_11334 [Halolactibacillus halophilus]|uniref:Sporulation and spore germination n=1 Tax=Halolactibacillus halophilus TaxID=306540 RepID=A0A1I5P7V1_9BACI|nr:hypothetical protein [Halolactibacillus halophilus]GEM01674.1 hypothetical protein HHA03_12060 [Halolactibacillus halophilus]SFP30178.1 hypothetical protein SAMN05421839_11334 [Halolactibacillus halophilus]